MPADHWPADHHHTKNWKTDPIHALRLIQELANATRNGTTKPNQNLVDEIQEISFRCLNHLDDEARQDLQDEESKTASAAFRAARMEEEAQ